MRILIYALNYAPELTGCGKYNTELAQWLEDQGHQVSVVTAPPYYPFWKVQHPYRTGSYRRERLQGIEVRRCPLWVPRSPTGIKRLIHLLSFALSSAPVLIAAALRWKPALIFVVAPSLACAPAAALCGRLSGAATWLHIQDFEVDAAFDLQIVRASLVRRSVLAVERWIMKRFDRVSTISVSMHKKLDEKIKQPSKSRLFPNWIDTSPFMERTRSPEMVKKFGLDASRAIILYSGNMGAKQGIDIITSAARLLDSQSGPQFVLCGDGAERARLEREAADQKNVFFFALQPAEDFPDVLAMADVHLLPQRADAEDLVMPSKLLAILASARPVVATANPGSELHSAAKNGGIVVPPGDTESFAHAITRLLADKELATSLGEKGVRYVESQFDKHAVLARTLDEFELAVTNCE